ncbi:MAG: hypothetical protein P4L46_17095 [Fimbriimonas sp.]|nr:hypothetical protein [Fimbriimonas sp.]
MVGILWFMARAAIGFATAGSDMPTVPYLGREEPYFFGNGLAGAGGTTNGTWDFLIGPDYTSPNYISQETLSLVVDGKPVDLTFQMHRVRGAGVFTGIQRIGDLKVSVTDFSMPEAPWIARLVACTNQSKTISANIVVQAEVTPDAATGQIDHESALTLSAMEGVFCFGGETKNWADRYAQISFSEPCSVEQVGKRFRLRTRDHRLAPLGTFETGLFHWLHYTEGRSAAFYTARIRNQRPKIELDASLEAWRKWMRLSEKSLNRVIDPVERDAVEGSLIACKMQQNRDGGTIAGTRRYANSYVRDTHGAVRLFLATGHTAEVYQAIETIHHKWSIAGFIPNYWSMGSDSFIGHSFANESSEITGYYALMIRGYLAATHDMDILLWAGPSLKFAIDSQLRALEANQWRIGFNGDETEQYCVKKDGTEYGGFPAFPQWHNDAWSFPSSAIAVASAQFYADLLKSQHRDREAAEYEAKLKALRDSIDATFWKADVAPAHHVWARYRDGTWPSVAVPNYDLIPLWVGAKLNWDRQKGDALATKGLVIPSTGFLPTAPPDVMGFCGHNLGYLLYDLSVLHDPKAKEVLKTIATSGELGCWGTVSEFYGPNGTPNGHNFRVFESGITAEAILEFYSRR